MTMRGFLLRKESGFSLMEVLVAMLILVLGMLGILGVIINSLRLSSSSSYRTIASLQAAATAETIRANPSAISYDASAPAVPDCSTTGICSFSVLSPSTTSVSTSCLNAGGCGRSAFVNTSYWGWKKNLATMLPGGDGTICQDNNPSANAPVYTAGTATWNWSCSNSGQYVVKICWNESRISASQSTANATAIAGMLCTWTGI